MYLCGEIALSSGKNKKKRDLKSEETQGQKVIVLKNLESKGKSVDTDFPYIYLYKIIILDFLNRHYKNRFLKRAVILLIQRNFLPVVWPKPVHT